jgi:26S proteasome regulatory subunit N3
VAQFDSRFTLRALRSISSLRKQLDAAILSQTVANTCPHGKTAAILLRAIGLDEDAAETVLESAKSPPAKDPIPEIEIYLGILIQVWRHLQQT